jgi:murein DD-endopeptidase MepM/ murein hydrolase activator NlpD
LQLVTQTDEAGVFAQAVALPQSASLFSIVAYAQQQGTSDVTDDSNTVLVTLDAVDPFKSVSAIPSYYGVNTQEDIDRFLAGLITIEELRTIQLQAEVTDNTRGVDFDFLNYDAFSLIPGTDPATGYPDVYNPDGHIASVNNLSDDRYAWNPQGLDEIKRDWSTSFFNAGEILPQDACEVVDPDTESCLWLYNYPTPFWFGGGVYEIRFRGYKGSEVQDLTRAVSLTNQTISAPRLLRVEKLDAQGDAIEKAQPVGSQFFTNIKRVRLTGVGDPSATVIIQIPGLLPLMAAVPDSGIWVVEATLPDTETTYDLTITSLLNNLSQTSLEDYSIILDTTVPTVTEVLTSNQSNSLAVNPWLLSGDQIQFNVTTNEPLLTGSVFGELGFREDFYRFTNGVETSDSCYEAQTCSQAEWSTQDFRGRLTVLRPLQGVYYPYIKLQDLAGNVVFYSNNPNMDEINIDPFDGDLENSQVKTYINPEFQDVPVNYPYSPYSRLTSLDFQLFIDNQKPEKEEIIIDGWGNRLNGVYAGKKLEDGSTDVYIDDDQDVFEADRLLTDPEYVENDTCEITDNSFWDVYDPLEAFDPAGCPVSPAYVTKEGQAIITGWAEKYQQVVLSIDEGRSVGSGAGEVSNTSYQTITVPTTECVDYTTNPKLYPELSNADVSFPGDPIVGIHVDQISRGNLTTKFATKCKWTYIHDLDDDGTSPLGVPENWYRFSFHIRDLAGNTPVPTSNTPGVGGGDLDPDTILGSTIESRSVTIYHDTDDPDDYQISSINDSQHQPVIGFGDSSITRQQHVDVDQSGERAADIVYQATLRLITGQQIQVLFNQEPDNILGPESLLLQNEYDGNVTTTIPLGVDEQGYASEQPRDDEDLNNCTRISPTIPNKREGLCNDGVYTISSRETDTAGNTGDWIERSIERDTVRPDTPSVVAGKTGDIFQEYLSIDVTGEAFTSAEIKVTSDYGYNSTFNRNLDSNGKFLSSDFVALVCGQINYQVQIRLTDRAGNVGEWSNPQTVTTLECPRCSSTGNGIFTFPLGDNYDIARFTSDYPIRKIPSNYYTPHAGIDFGIPSGTPVYASYDGTVKRATHSFANTANYDAEWGNVVILTHNIEGVTHQTIYAHLDQTRVINSGDTVSQGQLIGYTGNSGASTGPHLHYQVEKQGAPLEPILAQDNKVRWNMQYPVNPRDYLGDITGNLSETQENYYCPNDGYGKGDKDNPWGQYQDAKELGDFTLKIRKNKDDNITTELTPPPIITYIDTEEQENQAIIYGLGIYKNSEMKVIVEEETCNQWFNCFFGGWEWKETTTFTDTIDHSEILINKENETNHIAQLWNDDPPYEKGKWKYDSIQIGDQSNQVQYGEKLCVTTKIHGNTSEGSEWYNNQSYDSSEVGGGCREVVDRDSFRINDWIAVDGPSSNNDTSGLLDNSLKDPAKPIDPTKRYVKLEPIGDYPEEYFREYPAGKKVWIISHGWCGGPDGFKIAAQNIKRNPEFSDDIFFALNWREAAHSGCGDPTKVNHASTWIRPTADAIGTELNRWGLVDPGSLYLAGHSLGSLMSSEISSTSFNRNAHMVIAIDPPRDGNKKLEVQNDVERQDFGGTGRNTRSFVGRYSTCGNYALSLTADDSVLTNFRDENGENLSQADDFEGIFDDNTFNPENSCIIHKNMRLMYNQLTTGYKNAQGEVFGTLFQGETFAPTDTRKYEWQKRKSSCYFNCNYFEGHEARMHVTEPDKPQLVEYYVDNNLKTVKLVELTI